MVSVSMPATHAYLVMALHFVSAMTLWMSGCRSGLVSGSTTCKSRLMLAQAFGVKSRERKRASGIDQAV